MKFRIEYKTQWGECVALRTAQQSYYLNTTDGVVWEGEADLIEGTEYRYEILRNDEIVRSEVAVMPHRVNHNYTKSTAANNVITDLWQDPQRVAGVAVPVFSLRSNGSQGVGDFGDLKMLIDWAEKAHLKVIQILPINDTTTDGTWQDSYPYNSISCNALHPMYLDLRQLDPNDFSTNEDFAELNKSTHLDYEKVNIAKRNYIRKYFAKEGKKIMKTKEYRTFFKANEEWLVPYSQFRAKNDNSNDTNLYCFTQYLLHTQLISTSEYARSKGIILKGDIPIGVNRYGVDAVTYPHLFNMDGQAGAPPDSFTRDGQNWGFPTYNWDEMAKDGYRWWRKRMEQMSQYFSAYRIDHILGFFRIWEIPVPEKSGLMGHFSPALPLSEKELGNWSDIKAIKSLMIEDSKKKGHWHIRIGAKEEPAYHSLCESDKEAFDRLYEYFFYHRHNQFWYDEAMKKLPILTRGNMMICCGEDLGMVPECVSWVMKRLNILSLEIQSMPKEMGVEFGNPQNNPILSVCTISSHDTPTFRGWWEENRESSQRYFNHVLGMKGIAPVKAPGWLCERVIRNHLMCPSVFCILTIQDWLGMDDTLRNPEASSERINIPAVPRHYWRWRMHITIEDLLNADSFNEHLRCLVDESGRG